MLSVEIATLCGKQHKHVLRDIENTLSKLSPELGLGFKSTTYKDSSGKSNKCYELNHEAFTIVITGYDVVSRAKVIRRWMELEAERTQYGLKALPVRYAPAMDEETKVHHYKGMKVLERGGYFWISSICRLYYKYPADFLKQRRFMQVHKNNPPALVSAKGTWVAKAVFIELAYWLSAECGEWADSLFVKKQPTITLQEYVDATAKLFGVSDSAVLALL